MRELILSAFVVFSIATDKTANDFSTYALQLMFNASRYCGPVCGGGRGRGGGGGGGGIRAATAFK